MIGSYGIWFLVGLVFLGVFRHLRVLFLGDFWFGFKVSGFVWFLWLVYSILVIWQAPCYLLRLPMVSCHWLVLLGSYKLVVCWFWFGSFGGKVLLNILTWFEFSTGFGFVTSPGLVLNSSIIVGCPPPLVFS